MMATKKQKWLLNADMTNSHIEIVDSNEDIAEVLDRSFGWKRHSGNDTLAVEEKHKKDEQSNDQEEKDDCRVDKGSKTVQLMNMSCGTADEMLSDSVEFSELYRKYVEQCTELKRVQSVNCQLKEHLKNSQLERESLVTSIKTLQRTFSKQRDLSTREMEDAEAKLKMSVQQAEAHKQQYQQQIKECNEKWNHKVIELTNRAESIEKEKNDIVCRYAAREAEVMRLKAQIEKMEEEKKLLVTAKDALQKSTQFESLQSLEHSLAETGRQLAIEKQANKELGESYKMTTKHLEASQTALAELRSQVKSIQSQLSFEQVEKLNYREELKKVQIKLKAAEQRYADEVHAAKRLAKDQEEIFKNLCDESNSFKSRNATLSQQLNVTIAENTQLQTECQRLSQELAQTRQAHQVGLEKLQHLEQIQTQMNSSLHRAELAENAAMEAASEREQAEAEAAECRKQAERMLEITKQLTDKNSSLTTQQELVRSRELELLQRLKNLELSVSAYEKRTSELQRELELLKIGKTAEILSLREQIDSKITKERQLNAEINELRNEKEVLKKKNTNSLKELRAELQYLRKNQMQSSDSVSPNTALASNVSLTALSNGPPTSSRTSSVASSGGDICIETINSVAPIGETVSHCDESHQSSSSLLANKTSHVQQQMIEKIVKLQGKLARRQNKIEFLEEHVRQCIVELRKKSKIIQNYALREEAALLLPEYELNRVLHALTAGNFCLRLNVNGNLTIEIPNSAEQSGDNWSNFFMGTLFPNSASDIDRKYKLGLEINSRLQAVLEDTLYRNITLKDDVNTLGKEISRLSRENRQLSLSKVE